jgi:hypothetical protein
VSTQVIIGDLRTGRNLVYLPASGVTALTWDVSRNQADSVSATFNLADDDTRKLGIPAAATPGAAFLVVVIDGVPVAGGPVWIWNYSKANRTLKVTGKGMWSYFDHRVLIPLVAQSTPVVDPVSGEPYGVMNTNLVGLSYGTIAKRLVATALAFTGGHVPVVLPADEVGPYQRSYLGTDLAMVGERLQQLTEVINGPDIAFTPRFTTDGQGMEWVMRTGTLDQPNLAGTTEHVWDYSVPEPSIADLEVTLDATNLVSRYWLSGGRSDDRTYIERADDLSLLNAGFPLLEASGSSDAETPALLQSKAREQVRIGRTPRSQWSFRVRADGDPKVTDVGVGDYCRVIIANDDVIPDSGPEGYRRRIAGMSGDIDGDWVKITVLETYQEG